MLIATVAFALLPHIALPHVPSPFHQKPPPTVRDYQERHGDWRVRIRQDSFARRSACTVFAGPIEPTAYAAYEAGRVVFRFRSNTETRNAWIRIDGGPPVSARADLLPKPVQYGAAANLDSSTGGFVFLPASALMTARTVEIRPSETAPVRRYAVAGLSEALDAVNARGCALEALD